MLLHLLSIATCNRRRAAPHLTLLAPSLSLPSAGNLLAIISQALPNMSRPIPNRGKPSLDVRMAFRRRVNSSAPDHVGPRPRTPPLFKFRGDPKNASPEEEEAAAAKQHVHLAS